MDSQDNKPWTGLVLTGATTAALYILLFAYEQQVMRSFTRTDGWYPLLPVATAFVFSFSHGAFTGYFWDVLGVKPRPRTQELADEADTD
jgi:hypothetical protein